MRSPERRSSMLASTTRLKYEPDANPAGFQNAADASSATAVKAPPIPAARTPTEEASVWADTEVAAANTISRGQMQDRGESRMASAYSKFSLTISVREGSEA